MHKIQQLLAQICMHPGVSIICTICI